MSFAGQAADLGVGLVELGVTSNIASKAAGGVDKRTQPRKKKSRAGKKMSRSTRKAYKKSKTKRRKSKEPNWFG